MFNRDLKCVHKFQQAAVRYLGTVPRLSDLFDHKRFATALPLPETRGCIIQRHEQAVQQGFLATCQNNPAPRLLTGKPPGEVGASRSEGFGSRALHPVLSAE